jgi:nitrate reductase NapAB chaperone NapD
MPVKSYLARPHEGQFKQLLEQLNKLNGCETVPSTNEEIIVVVTDTLDDQEDEKLLAMIHDIRSLKMLSMVSGFEVNT